MAMKLKVNATTAAHIGELPHETFESSALSGHFQLAANQYVNQHLPGYRLIGGAMCSPGCYRYEAVDEKQEFGAVIYVRRIYES